MSKIIFFVDIDGTVNLMPEYISNRSAFQAKLYDEINFNSNCINYLNELHEFCKTQLKKDVGIVISSAWRFGASISTFAKIFKNNDCNVPVIGKTPIFNFNDSSLPPDYMRNGRGREIERWLENCDEVIEDFVIFDDMTSDIIEVYPKRLIGLDSNEGINEEAYEQALEILSNEN